MIQIEHLSKSFDSPASRNRDSAMSCHHALQDVSLTIDDGDIFGIIGSSGAGKSTLVRCINLLERPTSGHIYVDGNEITRYRGRQLLQLRASMGMIFQHFSLFAQRSVLRNVTFPLEIQHEPRRTCDSRARELLQLVGIAEKEEAYPSQLSGGQQQRVAIARALANKPRVMLCDEATSALDTATTVSILRLLRSINVELGVTIIIITHSLAVTERICNKIAVLDKGRLVEQGPTREILQNPQSQATRELLVADTVAAFHGAEAAVGPACKGAFL
ncbi:MAG: methionine ABC transporter ATP-binding protein [Coriobacteriales bacterium]|jgi:D-methionine transport system ATP-binding protein|nr:methionine ABC transporter ATP-binding protein [Coriobacteriales bacterium]